MSFKATSVQVLMSTVIQLQCQFKNLLAYAGSFLKKYRQTFQLKKNSQNLFTQFFFLTTILVFTINNNYIVNYIIIVELAITLHT